MSKKHTSALILSIAVSLIILGFLFYNIDWQSFLKALKSFRLEALIVIAFLTYLSFWIRAVRWNYLLPGHYQNTPKALYDATVIGMFANNVLPLRAGEIIRPWVLKHRQKEVTFPAAFASIVTERVFDVISLLVCLGLSLGSVDTLPTFILLGAKALTVIAGIILIFMVLAYFRSSLLLNILEKILKLVFGSKKTSLQKLITDSAIEFLSGIKAIANGRELLAVVFWSFTLWITYAFLYQVGIWAMGETTSFNMGMVVCLLVALAVAAPSAPGFIGTFQAGAVFALATIYGLSQEVALAYAIVIHGAQFFTTIILGLIVLNRLGLGLKELQTQAAKS